MAVDWCSACGVDGALLPLRAPGPEVAPLRLDAAPSGRRWRASRSAIGRALGGSVDASALVLLAGEPGSGKTTCAIDLALELGRTVLHCDAEMTPAQCRDYWARAGASPEILASVPRIGAVGWAEALEQVELERPDVVIVDSLQRFARSSRSRAAFVNALRDLRRLVLLISHVNAHGGIVGGTGPEHDSDAELWITPTYVRFEKCRWAPAPSGGRVLRSELDGAGGEERESGEAHEPPS
jgi:DNA repair protein RadA/Sms